jgi:hypothetical protein
MCWIAPLSRSAISALPSGRNESRNDSSSRFVLGADHAVPSPRNRWAAGRFDAPRLTS